LLPSEIDDKTGDTVEEVLLSKHPAARVPDAAKMPEYPEVPDLVDLDIMDETVEKIASRPSGSAGVGGSDSHAVSHWLLQFGIASRCLRLAFAKVVEWLSNKTPPWAAYCALMMGRLLAPLHKSPGVQPVGVLGEHGDKASQSASFLRLATKPRKRAASTSSVLESKEASKAEYMRCST
jgi:hypothetical protein